MRDRLIQVACVVLAAIGITAGGMLLPRIVKISDERGLRYTDVSVEGAPPFVAIGTAIGALRGIIVDYLWIRATWMKEQGLFYEAMADADLITKLQPRFGEVWAFHGHNMAYNISVLTNTPQERWEWVKAGIDLVREQGLTYCPNDLILHKELAFWFAHKVDGVSDDAHLHYKRELAKEWHYLLGTPPPAAEDRIAWLADMASAPDSLDELERRVPQVKAMVGRLNSALGKFDRRFQFKLDRDFLLNMGKCLAVQESRYARILGLDAAFTANDPVYAALREVLADPANAEAVQPFLSFLRKKVLRESYNMDAALMRQYTEEFGPLDWRHPQAHAFYWAKKGSERAAKRYMNEDEIYKVLNNDRTNIQAMQALARSGLMYVDPFSNDNPGRLSDPRWIRAIDRYFSELYRKHYNVRGAGGDTFADFYQNFMTQAVRELYRLGDIAGAKEVLERLDSLFGRGGVTPSAKYDVPLDTFVRNAAFGEYEMVPDVARSDVFAALQRGYREGILMQNPEILKEAKRFAKELTDYFKSTRYTDFVNKFGEKRMGDLIGDIESSKEQVLCTVLMDQSQPLTDRLTIYNRCSEEDRRLAYDTVKPVLEAEFAESPLAPVAEFDRLLPEPPGMAEFRIVRAQEAAQREEAMKAQNRAAAVNR